eukprot:TRINITY_DN7336_c0_g1_i2.p2 TRINITY_DN7336_c0_g1~~TRINITY_DN7336_c0_g1_i2.p2  ORF type:complete len:129 (-),score=31.41 TRINITY_DN7336_c0_g1_i2:113-499(-)
MPTYELLTREDLTAVFSGMEAGKGGMLRIFGGAPPEDFAVFTVVSVQSVSGSRADRDAPDKKLAFEPSKQSDTVQKAITKLKEGDKIRLVWEHNLVKDENGQHPERTIKSIGPASSGGLLAKLGSCCS